ncbi:MAG TPA: helix-turn-helix domain-containing protein, partial [Tepidiformaceae bacterium]|nr:helix-turn-helix domain-containing protein [Tepidiformaceae bacterium]
SHMDTMTRETATHDLTPYCPSFHAAIELIGRRWTGAIVRTMLAGSFRFSDILAGVPGLSDRLLSQRLRELEAAGVVTRTVYPETPVRIEYQLTEKGRELDKIVGDLSEWADRWGPAAREAAARR